MPTLAFEAIGAPWKIHAPKELSAERQAALLRCATERAEAFDRTYSRFRDDSLVGTMSRQAGEFLLPDDAPPLFELYESLYRITNGAFTPLIGQTLEDAGYDASYTLRPKRMIAAPPPWDEVIASRPTASDPRLALKRPALLDVGAGGKGYLADLVGDALEREGFTGLLIDASGDIVCRGAGTTRVGLEDPDDPTRAIGVATISGGSVCGSAGNRRAWGSYHHTIDPRTLASPRDVAATWAFAPTGLVADALATALFLVPPPVLRNAYAFEYVVMWADRRVECSPSAPVELFT